jgi:hypothetical protein
LDWFVPQVDSVWLVVPAEAAAFYRLTLPCGYQLNGLVYYFLIIYFFYSPVILTACTGPMVVVGYITVQAAPWPWPLWKGFFLFILRVFVYFVYLHHPSKASTWYCAIPGGNTPEY